MRLFVFEQMRTNRAKSYWSGANGRAVVVRLLILSMLAVVMLACAVVSSGAADIDLATKKQREASEYQLKAVYLYNFLLFTEWPEDGSDKSKDLIVIGIVGKDRFRDAFKDVEGKPINGRTLIVKRFDNDASVESFKKCDLLFISSSLRREVPYILDSLRGRAVLTVSEINGFVESGGMINLLVRKQTVEFEINTAAAERVGIKFRSKLLRVAARVVDH